MPNIMCSTCRDTPLTPPCPDCHGHAYVSCEKAGCTYNRKPKRGRPRCMLCEKPYPSRKSRHIEIMGARFFVSLTLKDLHPKQRSDITWRAQHCSDECAELSLVVSDCIEVTK